MKTVRTSGGLLLTVTAFSVLSAGLIFVDAVNSHTFTSTHLLMMSLFGLFPTLSWARKIQLSADTLSYKWYLTIDEIALKQIERIEVMRQRDVCHFLVYRVNCRKPIISLPLDSFNHAAIKNFLHELQAQNPQIKIAVDKDF